EALGDDALVTLEARALYERAQPLIDRSVDQVERLFAGLREHGIDPDNQSELGALYLVGGGSAFPAVGRALRQRYGRKIQLAPQTHAATAIGLAIAGDPAASIFVREATTRHFGVWREAEGGRRKVFDPIFTKDLLVGDAPRVVRRRYRPIHRVGELRFLECSALDAGGQPEGDLTPWRTIRFPYDPSLADRPLAELRPERAPELSAQEIVETYTYRDDGTIAVEIANPGGGYRSDYVLGVLA
ncbi:MAG: hypothetical protein KC420_10640, partial [Myxococcales bacterium]|nr:hypothetical protein [Myxococcales bacterium]